VHEAVLEGSRVGTVGSSSACDRLEEEIDLR
jgi:hypothetical protein